jgi:hypothetical protein
MKKAIIFSSLIISFTFVLNAQNPNFSEHVAPIIYDNCSGCHHDGGIAKFPFLSYDDVYENRFGVHISVKNGSMPPWHADDIEGGWVHERKLSTDQINTILEWVEAGAPEGNSSLAPSPPVFATESFFLSDPDTTLRAPVYTSKADTEDDYVCFTIPTGLTTDKWVQAIEIVPGLADIVHHCLVYIDEDSSYRQDLSGKCGGPSGEILLGEYIPNSKPIVYPNEGNVKFGVFLKKNSQLILALHYSEGTIGIQDSIKVNLHFYPDSVSSIVREVFSDPYLEHKNFEIAPNTVREITIKRNEPLGISSKVSIFSFFPHMHNFGTQIEAWAKTPSGETIPLGKISEYDFDWQGYYVYRKLKIVPKGSEIFGKAVYNNTTNDTIHEGPATTDEMFVIYAQYLNYQDGDEDIDLNAILDSAGANTVTSVNVPKLNISPNPVSAGQALSITVPGAESYKLSILDIHGGIVVNETVTVANGQYQINNNLSPGVYLVTLKGDNNQYVSKLVVQ